MDTALATPLPHDLLWLTDQHALTPVGPAPDWLTEHWHSGLPVVVRREHTAAGQIPVGARGPARHQRLAGYVARPAIIRRLPPEALTRAQAWQMPWAASPYAALAALRALAPLLDATGLPWGPTGSVGYALATRTLHILHAGSDLDLLLRAPVPLTDAQRQALRHAVTSGPCRIDLQINTPLGGVAFTEWDRNPQLSLLRTAHGPHLVRCPWRDNSHLTPSKGNASCN